MSNQFKISRFTKLSNGPKVQYLLFHFNGDSFFTDYEIHFNNLKDKFQLVYDVRYCDALAPDIFLNHFLKSVASCDGITAV